MNSKLLEKELHIPRRFIDDFVREKGTSRGKEHDWDKLIPEIIKAWEQNPKSKSPRKQKKAYIIMNLKVRKKEGIVTSYIGAYLPEMQSELVRYVERRNYVSIRACKQLESLLDILNAYSDRISQEEIRNYSLKCYESIAKQECITNDYELIPCTRSRKPRDNKLSIEEIINDNKEGLLAPSLNESETLAILNIRRKQGIKLDDETIKIGKQKEKKDKYIDSSEINFSNLLFQEKVDNYNEISKNESTKIKALKSAQLFVHYLDNRIGIQSELLKSLKGTLNTVFCDCTNQNEELCNFKKQLKDYTKKIEDMETQLKIATSDFEKEQIVLYRKLHEIEDEASKKRKLLKNTEDSKIKKEIRSSLKDLKSRKETKESEILFNLAKLQEEKKKTDFKFLSNLYKEAEKIEECIELLEDILFCKNAYKQISDSFSIS